MVLGPTMVGPGVRIFKIKSLRWLERVILKLDFANTLCHKSSILVIFRAESAESVRFSRIQNPQLGPPLWARRTIAKRRFSNDWKTLL